MRTIAPLTLKDLPCKSPRRAPGPEGKSGDGEPDSDEDKDRHGLSRRPNAFFTGLRSGAGREQKATYWKPWGLLPSPIRERWVREDPEVTSICQLILKSPGRGDAEQLSERGAHLLLLRRDSCGVPSSHRLSPGCSESDCR